MSLLDANELHLAGHGEVAEGSWAFYDGHHPIPADLAALGQRLCIRWRDGTDSRVESVIAAPASPTSIDTLAVVRDVGDGIMVVVSGAPITTVEFCWTDGPVEDAATMSSPVTGNVFAVGYIPPGLTRVVIRLRKGEKSLTETTVVIGQWSPPASRPSNS